MRSEPVQDQCVRQSEGLRLPGRLRSLVAIGLVAACAACAALPAVAAAETIAEKRAKAAKIAQQVSALENEYDHLQERYRGAEYRLRDLSSRVTDLTADLERTEAQLDVAQERLVARAVSVYESGSSTSPIVTLARAGSVSNFLERVETINRVGNQDARILREIKTLRKKVVTKRKQLKEARAEQVTVVAQSRRDKVAMGKKLSARQTVLNSVNGEIRALVEQERAAQAAAAAAAARASGRGVTARDGDSGVAAPAAGGDTGASLAPPVAAAPPAGAGAASAASVAMGYIGVPYLWGGATPSGFDCSGLVMYAFAQVGISLPHSSYALWNAGTHVSRDQLATGDLVFFSGLGHVGIYVGGGNYVHAPRSGTFVRVNSLYDSYGTSNYVGAVRISS